MRRVLLFVLLAFAVPAHAVTIEWVTVGDPGNAPDIGGCASTAGGGCGAVAEVYRISKYEVTNAQYAEFLNAVADADPVALYNDLMGSDANFGGIARSGVSGSYTYAAKPGFEAKPVVYVSFLDAARFANWIHNGQPSGAEGPGTTESGAYTFPGDPTFGMPHNPGALAFLPSEDEWYKAAYYDSALGVYYDYPTRTDTPTACVLPAGDTGNSANCLTGVLTDVGAYALSDSPSGTFDQGGNVWEWTESGGLIIRGGSYGASFGLFVGEVINNFANYDLDADVGFRLASIPEPGTGLLVMAGLLGMAARRRRWGLLRRVPRRDPARFAALSRRTLDEAVDSDRIIQSGDLALGR